MDYINIINQYLEKNPQYLYIHIRSRSNQQKKILFNHNYLVAPKIPTLNENKINDILYDFHKLLNIKNFPCEFITSNTLNGLAGKIEINESIKMLFFPHIEIIKKKSKNFNELSYIISSKDMFEHFSEIKFTNKTPF